ncbi:hypothetical protein LRE75_35935 [Streptomyces sp. 372A]|uniref:hypothetical protein n=1 Tax=Streptomyces sp. SAS_281 TaxID=3412744 RepID=UPI00403C30E0
MHIVKRLARMAVVAGSALVLVTGLSTSAQAASGLFYYLRGDNQAQVDFFDPPNDTCIKLDGGVMLAANATDTTVVLYAGSECEGYFAQLEPEQQVVWGVSAPVRSMKFHS